MSNFEEGIRESFTSKSRILNTLLTVVTGKPCGNEYRAVIRNPWLLIAWKLGVIFALVFSVFWSVFVGGVTGNLLALYFSIFLCGQFRELQVCFMHHCIHHKFVRHRRYNEVFADIICGLIFVQNRREYSHDHLGHHDKAVFTTAKDADANTLLSLGFVPGRSKKYYFGLLLSQFFGPRFHYDFLVARFTSVLRSKSTVTYVFAVLSLGSQFAILAWDAKFGFFALILPLFLLFNISALLQFLTEHLWLVSVEPPKSLTVYAERCWGRFCGTRRYSGFFPSIYWLGHMLLIALPTRFGCWVGDLPSHDWHHLSGFLGKKNAFWSEAIYLREDAVRTNDRLLLGSREVWGIHQALDLVFTGLVNSPVRLNKTHKINPKNLAEL